jgi:DNA-binding response OmpR family regulator
MTELRGSKVLVIDDEVTVLFALRDYFVYRGFDVTCVSDLQGALIELSTRQFDLIITDLRLSAADDPDSLDLLHSIRDKCEKTPIVMLTGYGSADTVRKARDLGVDVFLRKPIPLRDLERIVRNLLTRPKGAPGKASPP